MIRSEMPNSLQNPAYSCPAKNWQLCPLEDFEHIAELEHALETMRTWIEAKRKLAIVPINQVMKLRETIMKAEAEMEQIIDHSRRVKGEEEPRVLEETEDDKNLPKQNSLGNSGPGADEPGEGGMQRHNHRIHHG